MCVCVFEIYQTHPFYSFSPLLAILFKEPLPQDVDKDQLKSLFQSYGEVLSVCIKEKRNYAFVEMSTAEEAQEAINQLNNTEWMDITLTVSESTGFRNPNSASKQLIALFSIMFLLFPPL